jgi:hypothetical protein
MDWMIIDLALLGFTFGALVDLILAVRTYRVRGEADPRALTTVLKALWVRA